MKAAIDQWCVANYNDGHRTHLGASLIGRDCKRYLWYVFRWVKAEQFDGRMLRLFNRGHREEAPQIERLRGIGATVWDIDPSTGKQIRINGVNGHFGGSCDAVIQLPPEFEIPFPLLWECKTNGTGAGFSKLGSDGVQKAKPEHWAQMCTYGYKLDLGYAAYFNTNKNDDDLFIEVVELDRDKGRKMEDKAEGIIMSQTAPERLSDNPTYFACKICHFAKICHQGDFPEMNCRSCQFAKPVENAEWFCEYHNGIIPKDFIKGGCGNHIPVTNNVR